MPGQRTRTLPLKAFPFVDYIGTPLRLVVRFEMRSPRNAIVPRAGRIVGRLPKPVCRQADLKGPKFRVWSTLGGIR